MSTGSIDFHEWIIDKGRQCNSTFASHFCTAQKNFHWRYTKEWLKRLSFSYTANRAKNCCFTFTLHHGLIQLISLIQFQTFDLFARLFVMKSPERVFVMRVATMTDKLPRPITTMSVPNLVTVAICLASYLPTAFTNVNYLSYKCDKTPDTITDSPRTPGDNGFKVYVTGGPTSYTPGKPYTGSLT